MPLILSKAKESDATRIADIHMAAFGSNEMLLAQFPTPAARKGLWVSLVEKVVSELRDPKWAILVILHHNHRKIISFAKWCLPISKSEGYEEHPWRWPKETNMAILNQWTKKIGAANDKILRDLPCYRLSFIGTDPKYQGLGAASLLLKWGLDRSREENVPTVLEATPNATPFYQKFGFSAEERISMQLEAVNRNREPVLYEEIYFVSWPIMPLGYETFTKSEPLCVESAHSTAN
ncbi:hypothetical protein LOZ66_002767 [Ophidiomyces ophidiicola]|nr:hypothetical protein LOZ66_002767 [Ophidiomyces ophidiicola]